MNLQPRAFRADVTWVDVGNDCWRSAQVQAVNGANCTIKRFKEATIVGSVVILTSLVPVECRAIGAPICVRHAAGDATYTILEVIPSCFFSDAPRDQVASVATGIFSPGIIPHALIPGWTALLLWTA